MTAQPAHDRLDSKPFWKVQGVFDPDGLGSDFSYTIGLVSRGQPELHMWARPSLGDDPGLDWKFSLRDCCGILNELADLLLRGEIAVGSRVTRQYDDGLATVEFRVDPPGNRHDLQAFGVAPGAAVLPVRWSLRRVPAGSLLPLTADALAGAERSWIELTKRLDVHRPPLAGWAVPGWTLPDSPDFAADQRFGPLTPLVLARGAQLAQADAWTIAGFVNAAATIDAAGSLSWPITHAHAIARGVGRSEHVHAVQHEVTELVASLTAPGVVWDTVVDTLLGEPSPQAEAGERERATRNLSELLHTAMTACLSTQVVADIAPRSLWLSGLGAWEATQGGSGGFSAPEAWHASPSVVDVVRRLLRRRSAATLHRIGLLHDVTLSHSSANERTRHYSDLETRLTGWALTSAAACPPVLELLDGTKAGRELASGAAGHLGDPTIAALQEWVNCLTSALTHRARLSASDVRVFAWPVRPSLPGLERVLNSPI